MSEQLREKITDICKKMDTRLCILHDVNHIYPPDDTPRGVLPAQRYDIYPCPPGYEGDPEMCLVCAVDQILIAISEAGYICVGKEAVRAMMGDEPPSEDYGEAMLQAEKEDLAKQLEQMPKIPPEQIEGIIQKLWWSCRNHHGFNVHLIAKEAIQAQREVDAKWIVEQGLVTLPTGAELAKAYLEVMGFPWKPSELQIKQAEEVLHRLRERG